jgi:hypothetical protein
MIHMHQVRVWIWIQLKPARTVWPWETRVVSRTPFHLDQKLGVITIRAWNVLLTRAVSMKQEQEAARRTLCRDVWRLKECVAMTTIVVTNIKIRTAPCRAFAWPSFSWEIAVMPARPLAHHLLSVWNPLDPLAPRVRTCQ